PPVGPAFPPRRRRRGDVGAEGRAARAPPGLLRQAGQGAAGAGGPRSLSRVLCARARQAAGGGLSRGIRGGTALAHREADHGLPAARVPAVHAWPTRGVLHAGSRQDARVRARHGRAPAGAVDREDRGAVRADVLLPLGPPRTLASRPGRRGTAAAPARRAGAAQRPVSGGRGVPRPVALERLIARYLAGAVYSTPALMARLFGLGRGEVEATLTGLARTGRVSPPFE